MTARDMARPAGRTLDLPGVDLVDAPESWGGSDERLTPPELVALLGPFDLDPAASIGQPWPTASRHLTRVENGLVMDWGAPGDRIWLNPPYSKPAPWMARLAAHGRGTALVPVATECDWWASSIWSAATAILFLRGRFRFCRRDGSRFSRPAPFPVALIGYGIYDADRLADSGIDGAFVPLATRGQMLVVLRPAPEQRSWRHLLIELARIEGGQINLATAYVLMEGHPKTAGRGWWRAKIRQVLQGSSFVRVAPATYRLEGVI